MLINNHSFNVTLRVDKMNYLKQLYQQHEGKSSDKWDIYLDVYDELFFERRSNVSSFLEIGVQNGGSLEIWSKYFSSAQHLVGCDINPDCAKLNYDNPSIEVVIGNSSTVEIKEKILSISSAFDVIIDDGSHVSSDIIKSFLLYFPLIADDGIYIIEDLHASYWESFEGGLYYPYSSMSFLKKLADVPNQEHWGVKRDAKDYLSPFYRFYNCESIDSVDYSTIHSVTFVNSLCVIKKKKSESNILGSRHIAGTEWDVFSRNKNSQGLKINCIPQEKNIWSQLDTFPEMEWTKLVTNGVDNENINISLQQQIELSQHELNVKIKTLLNEISQKELSYENLLEENARISVKLKNITTENHAILTSNSWRITQPLRALMRKFKRN
ncbi:class I SAM-dependent methyltransferase [Pantoea sp. PNT02]|nr:MULTISPECIES: class I SAM-dependent methyltransferase [Pantoea]MBD9642457.1 class I SAM-dependent methyltransferase [Pantoea sp. PNT02]